MIQRITLQTAAPVRFPQLRLSMHQPTLRDIGTIGQKTLYSGCQVLRFTKDSLKAADRMRLINYSDFDIIMSILNDKSPQARKSRNNVILVLQILFPNCQVKFQKDITLVRGDKQYHLDNSNFQIFRSNLSTILCLGSTTTSDYKAAGAMAQRIIDKLNAGKAKKNATLPQSTDKSVLSRYVSILAVGQHKDMNDMANYTLYQLYDEFKRFQLRQEQEMYIRQKLVGAKNIKAPQSWMKDLYEDQKSDRDIRKLIR